ncbi:MAG TPA: hypothetical protein PLL67_06405, partial [Gammaproteobacteria bacterium]|nr:hypothetical protein [Gammaproteobacteria bacterium]
KQAELKKRAEAAENERKLSIQNNTLTKKLSRTQQFFAFVAGIFKSKPPTAPTTSATVLPTAPGAAEKLHSSLQERLSKLKKRGQAQPEETALKKGAKPLILSPKPKSALSSLHKPVQSDKVPKTPKPGSR